MTAEEEAEAAYQAAQAEGMKTAKEDDERLRRDVEEYKRSGADNLPWNRSRSREEVLAGMRNLILNHPDQPDIWDLEGFLRRQNARREDIFTPEFQAELDARRQSTRKTLESEISALTAPAPYVQKVVFEDLFWRTRPSEADMATLRSLYQTWSDKNEENRLKVIAFILAKFGTAQDMAKIADGASSENAVLRHAALHGISVGKGTPALVEWVVPRVSIASWPVNERVSFLQSVSGGVESLRLRRRTSRPSTEADRNEAERILGAAQPNLDALRRAALASPEPFERSMAADLLDLSRAEDRREFQTLVDGNPDGILTHHLITTLAGGAYLDDPSVHALGYSLLSHRNPAVRSGLVEVLENWGGGAGAERDKARDALRNLASADSDAGIRRTAQEALDRLAEDDRENAELDDR